MAPTRNAPAPARAPPEGSRAATPGPHRNVAELGRLAPLIIQNGPIAPRFVGAQAFQRIRAERPVESGPAQHASEARGSPSASRLPCRSCAILRLGCVMPV